MADSYIYDRITSSIIASLENGVDKWKRPWTVKTGHGSPLPYNVASGATYRGINTVMLWCAVEENQYTTNCFGTYQQWQERGGQVRRGAKATHIMFFKPTEYQVEGEDDARKSLIARGYTVFNQDQVDGYTPKAVAELPEVDRIANAEDFFAGTGANIHTGGNRAFYMPSMDIVQIPDIKAFGEPVRYYSTLAHECVHWTSIESRCDRKLTGRFGSEAYAVEEMVAEIGAAFLCGILGLDSDVREDHAQYVGGWIKVLKSDNRAIFTVASAAQKAVDYLVSLQVEEVGEDQLAA